MKRLTFEGNFCDIAMCQENPCPYNGSCSQKEVWEQLKHYEDMEEQGRLVVLPCKLEADIFRLGVKEVRGDWQVAYAEVFPDEIVMIDDSDNVFTEEDIGKTVFLTREEAEKALRGGAKE